MDPHMLAAQLESGRSIEVLARELGRDPSTVAYWVNKHGLASTHAAKHASRGGIPREQLAALVEDGLTVRAIAERVGMSCSTVRHWLRRTGCRLGVDHSHEARTLAVSSTIAASTDG
jgi:transposase-like protein